MNFREMDIKHSYISKGDDNIADSFLNPIIDFENGVIKVEKTLCYLPNNGNAIYEFHRPKTLQKMLFVLLGFRKFL